MRLATSEYIVPKAEFQRAGWSLPADGAAVPEYVLLMGPWTLSIMWRLSNIWPTMATELILATLVEMQAFRTLAKVLAKPLTLLVD
jgi:hypothetical protein